MEIQKPTVGRIVIYRTDGRNGLNYDLPAIITCTQESHPGDYPDGQRNPCPVPRSPSQVHLTVFTPGGFGSEIVAQEGGEEVFVGALFMKPGSGTYVEHNVPYAVPVVGTPYEDAAPSEYIPPRSWRYPEHTNETIKV